MAHPALLRRGSARARQRGSYRRQGHRPVLRSTRPDQSWTGSTTACPASSDVKEPPARSTARTRYQGGGRCRLHDDVAGAEDAGDVVLLVGQAQASPNRLSSPDGTPRAAGWVCGPQSSPTTTARPTSGTVRRSARAAAGGALSARPRNGPWPQSFAEYGTVVSAGPAMGRARPSNEPPVPDRILRLARTASRGALTGARRRAHTRPPAGEHMTPIA